MLAHMSLGRDAAIAMLSLAAGIGASWVHVRATIPPNEGAPASTTVAADPPSLRSAALPSRVPLRGTDFPDGVVALTWDDGPDAHTRELARFLHDEHVSATFFVVGSWVEGLSEEPGFGRTKLATGYAYQPVLAELIALGHRVGNHAKNHVLLGHATPSLMAEQLEPLPLPETRVRMFRAPGGWWTTESAEAFDQPALADFIGPIHWDIDAKDWESSLYCRSDRPRTECEPGPKPNEPRVRAEVIAQRYLAKIEAAKHGIVLLHDRVGDVGSTYALDVAKKLIPELVARGYVFAPPVLRFGAFAPAPKPPGHAHTGDLNGDGRDDRCSVVPNGVECALAKADGLAPATLWSTSHLADFTLADVNGDGRADLCAEGACALAP
jgi:peptidoglycan/xylan/chitin deacetylase (PgdA/CDA1 family)